MGRMTPSEWKKKKEGNWQEISDTTVTPTVTSPETTTSDASTVRMTPLEWKEQKSSTSLYWWSQYSASLLKEIQDKSKDWSYVNEHDSYSSKISNLLSQADSWRKQYADNSEAISYIDSIVDALSSQKDNGWKVKQYYSNWGSENEYQTAVEKYQAEQEMLSYDLAAGQREIDDLQAKREAGQREYAQKSQNIYPYTDEHIALEEWYQREYGWIDGEIEEKQKYLDESKRLQEAVAEKSYWEEYKNDPEFKKYAAAGAAIENPSVSDAEGWAYIFGWRPGSEEVGNIVTYSRDNWDQIATISEGGRYAHIGNLTYRHMTNDEVRLYNYLLAKEGKDVAQEYLDYLDPYLRQQEGKRIADALTGIDVPVLEELMIGTYGLGAGLDQFVSGMKQLFTDEELTPSITQYASAEIANSLDGFGKYAYQATTTVGNMAPSILVTAVTGGMGAPSAVAQAAGAVTIGASASGNAYGEALRMGYDKGDARAYSILVGVSEASLQYLISGTGTPGGKLTESLMNKIAMIDSSLLRISAKLGVGILSEITEEELQLFLEPAFRSIISGEDYDAPTIDAIIETAIVTALSTGALEGGGTIKSDVSNSRYYKDTYGSSQAELVAEGLDMPAGTYANVLAQKYQASLNKGNDLTGHQLGQMVEANEQQYHVNDTASIQRATEARLTELGETGDVAAIAKALAKQASGEKLSRSEKQLIGDSKYGQRVANELSAENIRSGQYSSAWAESIDTERINAQEYSRLVEAAQQPQEATKTAGSQVVADTPKTAQAPQATPVVAPATTVPANDQQMAGKEAVQATKEAPAAEEPKAKAVSLENVSKKYGAQAQAMVHTYQAGQDVAKYDQGYQAAYDMGKAGVAFSYLEKSPAVSYLTDSQKLLAYEAGKAASDTAAKELDAKNKAATNGKPGRKKGTVRGEGVTISDLKQTFNDTQGKAYKYLSTVAEVTGIDIVLYRSEAGADGKFQGAQGRYSRSEPGTIYIDLNAGLSDIKSVDDLAKYAMLRTFSHEFTHFIENWNPIQYNELRKVVFDTLTERGENVHDLIEDKQARNPGMSYDKASREVVAEAMTDILPDSNFVQELAENHKGLFKQLIGKLKEFVANLRAYFNSIGHNRSREANALKEQVGDTIKYLDNIVQMFDRAAVQAVENYQNTVATEKTTQEVQDNGTEQADQSTQTLHGGRKTSVSEMGNGARPEAGDRSGVSEEVGARQEDPASERQHGELNVEQRPFSKDNYIIPEKGSSLHDVQKSFADYGIECHIVKASAWVRKNPAHAHNGIVYISDGIDANTLATAVPHEMTHVMKQNSFQPYLDFINKTPDLLNRQTDNWAKLMKTVSNHRGIDIFELDDVQRTNLYDELNAMVYGLYKSGIFDNSAFEFGEWMPGAFYDFDGYIQEMDNIHAQYKKQFGTVEKAAEEAPAQQDAYTSLSNQLNQYTHVDIDGIRYSAKANGKGGYYGNIKRLPAKAGGVPVENARATIYSSYTPGFATREEAIADLVDVARNNKLLGEVQAAEKEEVTANVENVDNQAAVQQPEPDGSGAAQVLDAVQTGDVSGNGISRNTVADAGERGQQTERHGDRPDTQGPSRGSSEGSRQSGDLRQSDGVSQEEQSARDYVSQKGYDIKINSLASKKGMTQIDIYDNEGLPTSRYVMINEASDWNKVKETVDAHEEWKKQRAEKLKETVAAQVEQQSTEQPKGRNFVIGDSLDLPSGEKARYKANVEAIRLVKQLEAEGRYATEAEQVILSKYVGWGGLANAFDQKKAEWSKEFAELKELLTDEEYSSARGSTLNAHYTDISVIKAMYDGLKQLGFTGGRMMEPSSGVGNFVGAMPADMAANVRSWTMVELDGITGLIAKYLYPNADVRIQGFEKANIPNNFMDVAISNVPFGNYAIADRSYPKKVTSAIHNYFFAKSLDKVRPGGIVMFITSSYTMNSKDSTVRRYIMQKADLLGAIRLPDSAFKGNAGTEVVTDILVLKKRADNTNYAGVDFLEAPYQYVDGFYSGANINKYFLEHPEMVLGKATMTGGMYRADSLTYKAFTDKGSLADQIREAFKNIQGKMEYPAKQTPEKTNFAVERAGKKAKNNSLVVKDGKVYQNKDGELQEVTVAKGAAERITGMLEIRDAAKELIAYQQQGLKDTEIKKPC